MEVTAEQLEYEFAVNVFGVIYMTQAVVGVGHMPKGGRIINIGSIASKILVPPLIYDVTKAAQDALTTLWAGEVSLVFFPRSTLDNHLMQWRTAWHQQWNYCQYTRTRPSSNRYVGTVPGGA
jgi:hypothetical protein